MNPDRFVGIFQCRDFSGDPVRTRMRPQNPPRGLVMHDSHRIIIIVYTREAPRPSVRPRLLHGFGNNVKSRPQFAFVVFVAHVEMVSDLVC